jgi:hypothetical protein
VARARHPRKEVEAAIRAAEAAGWTVVIRGTAHAWGILRCPGGRGACAMSVNSTPQNGGNHAKAIERYLARCTHKRGGAR